MGRATRTLGALTAAAGLGLLPAAPAAAAPGWTSAAAYSLPPGASPALAQIGYAAGGTATVAYLQTLSPAPFQSLLHVGTIGPGDGYDEQFSSGSPGASAPEAFRLAVAPDGAAVLEWSALQSGDPDTGPLAVLASFRPAGGRAWTAPATLLSGISQVAGSPLGLVPAIAPQAGEAAAAVEIPQSGGGDQLEVSTASSAGAWGPPVQLAATAAPAAPSATNVALGYDDTGELTAAYDSAIANGQHTVGDQELPAGAAGWSGFTDITGSDPAATAGAPDLAVSADGSAVLAFPYTDPAATGSPQAEATTRSGPAGTWSAPAALTPHGATTSTPLAAGISSSDQADVLLQEASPSSGTCAGTARAPISGTFTVPGCVSAPGLNPPLTGGVAFVGSSAYFAWSGAGPPDPVQGSSWPAAATGPSAAVTLAPTAAQTLTQVLSDADSGVAALWTNGSADLEVSAFDAGGPNLIAADVPARLPALQTATFDATFADLWSGVPFPPEWSFGDGVTEAGAQVSHAYAKAGTYPVTVTAADGLANITTRTFTVVVGPPAPRLSGLGVSPVRWTEGSHTTIRFSLSEAATVKLGFTALSPHARPAGTLTLQARRGSNHLRFTGRISGRAARIPPGRYAVTLMATRGGESSAIKRLTFTVVKAVPQAR